MVKLLRQSVALSIATIAIGSGTLAGSDPQPPDFRFEIRPILSKNCFACHGPDEQNRQADLRLDVREVPLEFGAIVPGAPEDSELLRRITSENAEERMPPPEANHRLSAEEVEKIRRWIAAGAEYARHWSYEPPRKAELPKVTDPKWCRNSIDHFILAKLEVAGIKPAPEADHYRLIRRLSLDLIGLPPTPAEAEQFVNDNRPDAYERLVDRLLESPAYGEHWARQWLDLARYADTKGYEKDAKRTVWAYRDWVIDALNSDMPFDQFSVEQLAGDLLPTPNQSQLIATGFHRNTMENDEGGTDDEEFRVAAVVDRVNTTMQVWMGTTMRCCQCHTHKYDPLTQREYYEVFAFFNQSADADREDQAPTLDTPTPAQGERAAKLKQQLEQSERSFQVEVAALADDRRAWEEAIVEGVSWQPLAPSRAESSGGAICKVLDDGSIIVSGESTATDTYTIVSSSPLGRITAIRLEALPHESLPQGGPGRSKDGGFVLSRIRVLPAGLSQLTDKVKYVRVELSERHDYLSLAEVQVFRGDENVALRGSATQSSTAYEGPAQGAINGFTDGAYGNGGNVTHTAFEFNPWWEVDLGEPTSVDRVVVWNRKEFGFRLANSRVTMLDADRQPVWQQKLLHAPEPSATLLTSDAPNTVLARAAASSEEEAFPATRVLENRDQASHGWSPNSQAEGPQTLTVGLDEPLTAEGPLQLKVILDHSYRAGTGEAQTLGHFRLLVTNHPRAAQSATVPQSIRRIAFISPEKRTVQQEQELAEYYCSITPRLMRLAADRADLQRQLSEVPPDRALVMQELPPEQRRTTHLLVRGSFLDRGEKVEPNTPEVFPPLREEMPRNRLGLAKWLVDRDNPLTARVVVNRHWEQLFGNGIVQTSEDFGSQGALPSHPELLDWLAVELMENNWSQKQLAKIIVMSAAYRQSSRVSPRKLDRDPQNRLVSRGPRTQLTAEQVRDQALSVSGLLSNRIGGPSVMPPQPEGIWQIVYSEDRWTTSPGDDRYRRGLYTFWRRTSPYPSAMALDATSRETCTIRRVPTNTPVAAFTLLNDPVYVEAAQALARRIAELDDSAPASRAEHAFRRVLVRPPQPEEVGRLVKLFEAEREYYRLHPKAATAMATSELSAPMKSHDMAELAAWTVVSNVLLNLDETLMK